MKWAVGLRHIIHLGLIAWSSSVLVAGDLQVYPQEGTIDQGVSSRQIHWYDNASPGQFAINYHPAPWKDEYAEQFEQLTRGKYFRLGQEFYTTLDTNVPIEIDGLEVPVGEHYLAVRRSAHGEKWELVLFDAAKVRSQRIPAGFLHKGSADHMPIFGAAPLRHQLRDQSAQNLDIILSSKPEDLQAGLGDKAEGQEMVLLIDFGPHRLSAPIKGHWASPENEFPPHRSIAQRASTRRFYFDPTGKDGSYLHLGQYVISYNLVSWRPEHEEKFDELTKGSYWRLGRNFWTVLDASTTVEIGGTKIPPGYYYLLVYRSQDGSKWELHVLDPGPIRQMRLDSAQALPDYGLKMPVLYRAPLELSRSAQVQKELNVLLAPDGEDVALSQLRIAFGPYLLKAPSRAVLDRD